MTSVAAGVDAPLDPAQHPPVLLELTARRWREGVDSVRRARVVKMIDGRIAPGPDDGPEPTIRLGPVARWGVTYGALFALLGACGVTPVEVLADGGAWR